MKTRKTLLTLLISSLLAATSPGAIASGGHRGGHHGGHHGGGHVGDIATGLIIGGVFGYLINEDRYRYNNSYAYRDYRYDDYARSPDVYEQVEPLPKVLITERDSEFAGHNCTMTREYTTTITINGVDKEAYGTRCMTADGGWVLGRPKLIPDQ